MAMIERGAAGTPEREAFYTRINAFGRASSREPVCPPVASRLTTHHRQPGGLFGCVSCEAREPENHPLRAIRAIVDEALELLSAQFEGHYGRGRSPSIASEKLQRSLLLKAFYTIRSEPQLIEQLGYKPVVPLVRRTASRRAAMGRGSVHQQLRAGVGQRCGWAIPGCIGEPSSGREAAVE